MLKNPDTKLSQRIIEYLFYYMKKKQKKQNNLVNHFVDKKENTIEFDLMDPNLPEWNYPIIAHSGAGQTIQLDEPNSSTKSKPENS